MTCQKRGPLAGDVIGALCTCGHVNIAHDEGGCAVCALRALVPLADPQPPSLREQVAEALGCSCEWRSTPATCPDLTYADAVLAALADWLAAQPLAPWYMTTPRQQRDHDVRLLRGGS